MEGAREIALAIQLLLQVRLNLFLVLLVYYYFCVSSRICAALLKFLGILRNPCGNIACSRLDSLTRWESGFQGRGALHAMPAPMRTFHQIALKTMQSPKLFPIGASRLN